MDTPALKDTAWLAKRLGLSITTIERLRAKNSTEIPAHIAIGHSLRYDPRVVEEWISNQLSTTQSFNPPSSIGEPS